MQLLLVTLICATPICATRFAYERGSCDGSVFNVVQELVQNEMRALLNPTLRHSNNKLLQYDLYTPHNPHKRQQLRTNDIIGLKQSYFNAKWPVRISLHGWTGKGTSCSNAAIKDAYLARGNFNVIIVDWSAHSFDLSYGRLTRQMPAIAATLVKFVRFLHRETGLPYESIYLIGHSAGSHIAGLAGKILQPERFGVIYAIDPAGLSQLGAPASQRLAPTDADYVESIHTDTVLLGNPSAELSQATFFVNWGQGQPQCPNATAAEFDIACDHFAALYYFAESVRNPKSFGAVRCHNAQSIERFSCGCGSTTAATNLAATAATTTATVTTAETCAAIVYMGGEPAVPKNGIHYLSTNEQAPYGCGDKVHIRAPLQPNYARSRNFLSMRLIDKIYLTL